LKTLSLKNLSSFLLISAHIAGFIGLQLSGTRSLFEALVPFNLLLTAFILFAAHQDWNKHFYIFTAAAFAGGFGIEVLGVHTGAVFGNYWYETTLGWKLWDVPVLIGLNWVVLLYICGDLAARLFSNVFLKTLFGASLMVFLDYWIEPVAMRHHFWDWQGGVVPLQNYIAWGFVSACLLRLYYHLQFSKSNPFSLLVYCCQLCFFATHCLVYSFRN
jgi:putative membrane protein